MQTRLDKSLVAAIRNCRIRATKPRLRVLAFLQQAKYPLSVKGIVNGVGSTNIDQGTVYRILDMFKKAGLVVQVDFQQNCAYYELKDAKHDHHHIVCTECHRVEDFTGCDYAKLADKALKQVKTFAKVTHHSLELFGLCNLCIHKSSPPTTVMMRPVERST